jgi:hypothetical protein
VRKGKQWSYLQWRKYVLVRSGHWQNLRKVKDWRWRSLTEEYLCVLLASYFIMFIKEVNYLIRRGVTNVIRRAYARRMLFKARSFNNKYRFYACLTVYFLNASVASTIADDYNNKYHTISSPYIAVSVPFRTCLNDTASDERGWTNSDYRPNLPRGAVDPRLSQDWIAIGMQSLSAMTSMKCTGKRSGDWEGERREESPKETGDINVCEWGWIENGVATASEVRMRDSSGREWIASVTPRGPTESYG